MSAYSSCAPADNVQYVRGRGEVVHAFQAALAEELSVSAGETVRLIPKKVSCLALHQHWLRLVDRLLLGAFQHE